MAALPLPKRGRALEDVLIIRAIALWRGIHGVFFTILALALIGVEFGLPRLKDEAQLILNAAGNLLDQTHNGHSFVADRLRDLADLDRGTISILLATAIFYAVLESVEAIYLWKLRRWAEYLTVIATAALIPFEIYELTEKVSVFRVGALVINLAVLVYLVWTKRLFGLRGGTKAQEAELAHAVAWPQVLAMPPAESTELLDRLPSPTHHPAGWEPVPPSAEQASEQLTGDSATR